MGKFILIKILKEKEVSMASVKAHFLQKVTGINRANKENFTKMESVFLKES